MYIIIVLSTESSTLGTISTHKLRFISKSSTASLKKLFKISAQEIGSVMISLSFKSVILLLFGVLSEKTV